ncbi:hypothetical protein GCM10020256_35700 [Streptomyces thermocoprophilus]
MGTATGGPDGHHRPSPTVPLSPPAETPAETPTGEAPSTATAPRPPCAPRRMPHPADLCG